MQDNNVSSRHAILNSAFDVLSQNLGASLADVAKQAGVGRATLHRHFASRDDLMVALAKQAMAELNEAVDAATANALSYGEGLRLTLHAVLPLAHRQMFLANETVDDPSLKALYAQDRAELTIAIDMAKNEGRLDQNVPTAWIATAFDHLVYAGWGMVIAGELTAKQAADLAWRTLTKGVAK